MVGDDGHGHGHVVGGRLGLWKVRIVVMVMVMKLVVGDGDSVINMMRFGFYRFVESEDCEYGDGDDVGGWW